MGHTVTIQSAPSAPSSRASVNLVPIHKQAILFKVKKGEDFNRPAWDTKRDRHPYIEVFRGLKSEPEAEIEEKGHLWMGTNLASFLSVTD